MNQLGRSRSQPATIGIRVLPVKTILVFAIDRDVSMRITIGAMIVAAPNEPTPRLIA